MMQKRHLCTRAFLQRGGGSPSTKVVSIFSAVVPHTVDTSGGCCPWGVPEEKPPRTSAQAYAGLTMNVVLQVGRYEAFEPVSQDPPPSGWVLRTGTPQKHHRTSEIAQKMISHKLWANLLHRPVASKLCPNPISMVLRNEVWPVEPVFQTSPTLHSHRLEPPHPPRQTPPIP